MDKILIIKILYAAASLQGIFLAALLWRTKVNQPANKILSSLLIIISFHLVLVGFDEREFFLAFPHLSRISWVIGTLYGPFVFLFIQKITQAPVKPSWLKIILFVPFLLVLINLAPYYIQSAEIKRAYLSEFEKSVQDDFGWINQFVSVVHIVFAIGNLLFYLQWERKQQEEFSAIEAIRVKWLRQFLVFLLVITLFGVLVFFARAWHLSFLSNFYRFHFIGVVFLFYWLSYKALTQPVLFGMVREIPSHILVENQSSEKFIRASVENEQMEKAFLKVKSTLETETLYIKNDLTLTQLSEKVGLPRHHVSQAINTIYKGNFFDLINDYRVEAFKEKALNPANAHLSLLGIALESGFNSKASFYSVFKKKTGLTPSEFIEKQAKTV